RTMIGQLILRLRAEGLAEGRKVQQVMRDVEASARRLSAAGTASWGVGFQRQLNALKLSANDINKVQRSWVALHDSIKSRNLSSALGKAEISHWKTHTLSNLAAFRTEY